MSRTAPGAGGTTAAPPPPPDEELQRLAALRALRLLDTPAEERFDRITRLATELIGLPIALISLVDLDRNWPKSVAGAQRRSIPIESSFCAHAVHQEGLFEIPDATADPRFADNPFVTGDEHVRFYAGQPLLAPSGHRVGTLCIIDREPRTLSDAQRRQLRDLAVWAETEFAVDWLGGQAERANRTRDEFVSVVSHELRTPLTAMQGSLELLASGRFGDLPGSARRLSDIALANTRRMTKLADDILDLQQVTTGKLSLKLSDVDLAEVLRHAEQLVGGLAEVHGVELELRLMPVAVRGDEDRLVQVATNLLANAVAFTPAGGEVLLTCVAGAYRAELVVADRGIGVPAAELERMFQPFVQPIAPPPGRKRGSGLGLAITRGIVEAHGGTVRAAARSGGGTVVTVTLPPTGPEIDRPWW